MEFPKCQKFVMVGGGIEGKLGSVPCQGTLLPLSDYGPDGAGVQYKAWVCSNDACGHSIRVDKGVVKYERVPAEHR